MHNEPVHPIIHPSWHECMQPLFNDPKMMSIKNNILPYEPFWPEAKNIFRVFEMPIENINVVLMGQDPYIKGEAIGYAYAVDKYNNLTPTLKIMQKELIRSEAFTHNSIMTKDWKELTHWREQGVFLLNAALTVKRGESGTHLGYWQWFTRAVLEYLSNKIEAVYLLWGSAAKSYKECLGNYVAPAGSNLEWSIIMPIELEGYNVVFEANHPAAETHPNSKYLFSGCDHYNYCNKALELKHKAKINW